VSSLPRSCNKNHSGGNTAIGNTIPHRIRGAAATTTLKSSDIQIHHAAPYPRVADDGDAVATRAAPSPAGGSRPNTPAIAAFASHPPQKYDALVVVSFFITVQLPTILIGGRGGILLVVDGHHRRRSRRIRRPTTTTTAPRHGRVFQRVQDGIRRIALFSQLPIVRSFATRSRGYLLQVRSGHVQRRIASAATELPGQAEDATGARWGRSE
jgi:hypothetical protein